MLTGSPRKPSSPQTTSTNHTNVRLTPNVVLFRTGKRPIKKSLRSATWLCPCSAVQHACDGSPRLIAAGEGSISPDGPMASGIGQGWHPRSWLPPKLLRCLKRFAPNASASTRRVVISEQADASIDKGQ